jgi:UDP-glucose 4-epimerase
VRDEARVREACRGIDIVFHLAALVSIPYSYTAPSSYIDTNIRGTFNVLEAVRAVGVSRLVHTSTSEVYGTPDATPIRESHALKGQSPYSASKIAADKLCEAYARSFETPVVVLRPFNTYGPRQSARAVIPTILSQLLSGAREIAIGSSSPRRDFTYVSDTVEAFIKAASAVVDSGAVIQLGSGTAFSVADVFDMACRVLEVQAKLVSDPRRIRPSASEIPILLSDPTAAARVLGWRASIGLEEGIRRTTEWMTDWMPKYEPGRYST